MNITIGCDPELFIYSNHSKEFKSAHLYVPGNKKSPVKVPRGAIQVDGVAAEFNIVPARTQKEFIRNVRNVVSLLERVIRKHDPDLELRATPTAYFNAEVFEAFPPEVKLLGCEPDYNAYTKKVNPKPETNEPFRTGAGHIHIGWQNEDEIADAHFETCCDLVRNLDVVLANSEPAWDKDQKRRELYGKMGAFRPKTYGVEYRVLSNAWLNAEETVKYVYDATMATVSQFFKGMKIADKISPMHPAENFDQLCLILERYNIPSIKSYKLVTA